MGDGEGVGEGERRDGMSYSAASQFERLDFSYIEGISDPIERRFGQMALSQGLIVQEAPMITVDRPKLNKWDKLSTVCDFLIKQDELDSRF